MGEKIANRETGRWRIPATDKESESEIRKRLYNHCRFWETYFTWALDNSIPTIDVRSAADCQRANDIIGDIFHSRTIAWAHSDNKYKMFIGAFQQMETFLK